MTRAALVAALVGLVVLVVPAESAVAGHPSAPPLLTIDAESLQQLQAAGRPVLAVDLRPAEAFQSGRLPGARSIPLPTLAARRSEVPADTLIVLYADGVEDATVAYRYLRRAGHANVFVLEGGLAGWRAHGYGVER